VGVRAKILIVPKKNYNLKTLNPMLAELVLVLITTDKISTF
jgi:hypothetical protein